ncbi:thiamine pyrophosphate-dependent enzyme [Sphaerisporangium sp. B11E5]|uniref:thiamine pyrophosphate-dependent enzyme n=1 Tax=Sphaerisporangium sp. B11E5 TaxID=3153563 RepID=UPI00325EFA69
MTGAEAGDEAGATRDVRDAVFGAVRRAGITTVFGDPGAGDEPPLGGLPEDFTLVAGANEGIAAGLATGWVLGHDRPALVLMRTPAGCGALAAARANHAPLVVLAVRPDRSHPVLTPAGEHLVWSARPAHARDVPAAVARAALEAVTGRGPAAVFVPPDGWDEPYTAEPPVLMEARRPSHVSAEDVAPLAALLAGARSPVLVTGALTFTDHAWTALTSLADRLRCPVWQDPSATRPGFPQDHPRFAGVLPADGHRPAPEERNGRHPDLEVREPGEAEPSPVAGEPLETTASRADRAGGRPVLDGHDVVLVVGAPAFRAGELEVLVPDGATVAVVSDDPAQVHRGPASLALLASPAAVCERLAVTLPQRDDGAPATAGGPAAYGAAAEGESLRAGVVLAELAARLAPEAIVVEEAPAVRDGLHRLVPARRPLGHLSAVSSGRGFALPAAVGLRLARPDRPVVALLDGAATLSAAQALWTASYHRVGALFIVFTPTGGAAWPGFAGIDPASLARCLGCPAVRVDAYAALAEVFDEVVPSLWAREEPLLVDVLVDPDT